MVLAVFSPQFCAHLLGDLWLLPIDNYFMGRGSGIS